MYFNNCVLMNNSSSFINDQHQRAVEFCLLGNRDIKAHNACVENFKRHEQNLLMRAKDAETCHNQLGICKEQELGRKYVCFSRYLKCLENDSNK